MQMSKKYILTENDVVDNVTSTTAVKPLSAKQGKTLNDTLVGHTGNTSNPHNVTAAQVGAVAVAQGSENANKMVFVDASGNITTGGAIIVYTFDDLMTAMQTSQTVPIVLGCDMTSTQEIRASPNVLKLDGHTITSDEEEHRFAKIEYGTLKILGPGTLTKFKNTSGDGGCLYVDSAILIMNDCNITNCSADKGGCVYVMNNGRFTMSGGNITNCCSTGWFGGGVYVCSESTFTMSDGNITNCSAESGGGGVYVYVGSFIMSGGNITNCSTDNGGGVYVNRATFTMSDGNITNCSAKNNGGGVYVYGGGSKFTMSGGNITNCSAKYCGGVYAVSASNINIKGSCIIQNNYSLNDDVLYNTNFSAGNFTLDGALTGKVGIKVSGTIVAGGTIGTATTNAKLASNIVSDDGSLKGSIDGTTLKWVNA